MITTSSADRVMSFPRAVAAPLLGPAAAPGPTNLGRTPRPSVRQATRKAQSASLSR